jgi:rhodanese-related sulfurtransferase
MPRFALMVLQTLFVSSLLPAAQAADPPAPAAAEKPATPAIQADELLSLQEAGGSKPVVLDVRTSAEFSAGHVPGAINIPHDQLANRLADLPASRDEPVVVYCRSGRRAALAEDVLRQNGFTKVRHLEGDMLGWEAAARPVERPAAAGAAPSN